MIQITKKEKDYELLDSGEGEKLERYGKYVLSRPDPQALWRKSAPELWPKADAVFSRRDPVGVRGDQATEWKLKAGVSRKWQVEFGGLRFWIKPSAFKHTGLFPEQKGNWEWIKKVLDSRRSLPRTRIRGGNDKVNVLNLFGYTGGATLAAAQAGAQICHVDGSKSAIGWARENAEISGLSEKPVRWILDDAVAFVKREIKRGRKYDGIIMDPPAFGHGPKGEMWKIEEDFLELMDLCAQLLSDKPLFFLVNGYASGYSSITYANNLESLVKKLAGGSVEHGELTIEEKSGRLLPCGIFARWSYGPC
ncbi:SAM-dependent methyltransferase [Patescibacteria group bacterium]|nr:MAG: SAM-dependent methyltransferase [Patescibacteria group bacterium]